MPYFLMQGRGPTGAMAQWVHSGPDFGASGYSGLGVPTHVAVNHVVGGAEGGGVQGATGPAGPTGPQGPAGAPGGGGGATGATGGNVMVGTAGAMAGDPNVRIQDGRVLLGATGPAAAAPASVGVASLGLDVRIRGRDSLRVVRPANLPENVRYDAPDRGGVFREFMTTDGGQTGTLGVFLGHPTETRHVTLRATGPVNVEAGPGDGFNIRVGGATAYGFGATAANFGTRDLVMPSGSVYLGNSEALYGQGLSGPIRLASVGADNVAYLGDALAVETDIVGRLVDIDIQGQPFPAWRFDGSGNLSGRGHVLTAVSDLYADVVRPRDVVQPSGYRQYGVNNGLAVFHVNPGTIASILASLPTSGGTLILAPGTYPALTLSTPGAVSRLHLIAEAPHSEGGTTFVSLPTLTWVANGNSSNLTITGCSVGALAIDPTSTGTNLICRLDTCRLATAGLAVNLSSLAQLRLTRCESGFGVTLVASGFILKDTHLNGAGLVAASITSTVYNTTFRTVGGTAVTHSMAREVFADASSIDSLLKNRDRLVGSGALRAIAGVQFGGILPDANADITAATGPTWSIHRNTADRTYRLAAGAVGDTVLIENRDTATGYKTLDSLGSGPIATLANGYGYGVALATGPRWEVYSRYVLA